MPPHDPASAPASPQTMANAIRVLAMDAVHQARSGHQGMPLGMADVATVLFTQALKYDAADPEWPDRDRFVLSIGHYAIGLYAALAEAGVIPLGELDTYGADGSRLEMSAPETTPGVELTGGSLGHGLTQSVGMALGLRLDGRGARVFNLLSDGECQEGSTWEAAMAGAHHGLGNLYAFIDYNNQQADGPPAKVMGLEPLHAKWAAFGWHTQRVNGNDPAAILAALAAAHATPGRPHAIVLDTLMGRGVPLFEQREKNHFIRVAPEEWTVAKSQLEAAAP